MALPENAVNALKYCDIELYPIVHQLLRILCTVPITSAECSPRAFLYYLAYVGWKPICERVRGPDLERSLPVYKISRITPTSPGCMESPKLKNHERFSKTNQRKIHLWTAIWFVWYFVTANENACPFNLSQLYDVEHFDNNIQII